MKILMYHIQINYQYLFIHLKYFIGWYSVIISFFFPETIVTMANNECTNFSLLQRHLRVRSKVGRWAYCSSVRSAFQWCSHVFQFMCKPSSRKLLLLEWKKVINFCDHESCTCSSWVNSWKSPVSHNLILHKFEKKRLFLIIVQRVTTKN